MSYWCSFPEDRPASGKGTPFPKGHEANPAILGWVPLIAPASAGHGLWLKPSREAATLTRYRVFTFKHLRLDYEENFFKNQAI